MTGGSGPAGVTLCLCGDAMTGRGIDQALPFPGDPRLLESNMPSARDYVARAGRQAGAPVAAMGLDEVWGDLPRALDAFAPAVRIANLETAITASEQPWPDKRYHFRMSRANADSLRAMRFDALCVANNHVLDWGREGLADTLGALRELGIAAAGAGPDLAAAAAPAAIALPGGGRVLVFACATPSSGVPAQWAARADRPGVQLLDERSPDAPAWLAHRVRAARRPGDLVVVSVHWGENWGFDVAAHERDFARALVDEAGVDVVHGHSAHHLRGVEVHRGRLILYGCGELVNDYERIASRDAYRHWLSCAWLATLDARTGALASLRMIPTRIGGLRVRVADAQDADTLRELLARLCEPLGCTVDACGDGHLQLRWQ